MSNFVAAMAVLISCAVVGEAGRDTEAVITQHQQEVAQVSVDLQELAKACARIAFATSAGEGKLVGGAWRETPPLWNYKFFGCELTNGNSPVWESVGLVSAATVGRVLSKYEGGVRLSAFCPERCGDLVKSYGGKDWAGVLQAIGHGLEGQFPQEWAAASVEERRQIVAIKVPEITYTFATKVKDIGFKGGRIKEIGCEESHAVPCLHTLTGDESHAVLAEAYVLCPQFFIRQGVAPADAASECNN